MAPFRSAKGFLIYGGIVLLLVALGGFFGIVGPTPGQSLFGDYWVFTTGENWAHLILGVVALLAAFVLKSESQQQWLVYAVGALALVVGVLGFFLSSEMPNFLGANLENPLDNLLHLIVAIWAFWAAMKKTTSSMGGGVPSQPRQAL